MPTAIDKAMNSWAARVGTSKRTASIDGTVAVKVTDERVTWLFRCTGEPSVERTAELREESVCTISADSTVLKGLCHNSLSPQEAWLDKRLSIEGMVTKALTFFSIACGHE